MDYIFIIVDNYNDYLGAYATKEEAISGAFDLYFINDKVDVNVEATKLKLNETEEGTEVILVDNENNREFHNYTIISKEVDLKGENIKTPEDYVKYMIDTYGVRSCYDDENEVATEDLWFECPECGEPILFADYPELFVENGHECPVCEEEV